MNSHIDPDLKAEIDSAYVREDSLAKSSLVRTDRGKTYRIVKQLGSTLYYADKSSYRGRSLKYWVVEDLETGKTLEMSSFWLWPITPLEALALQFE